MTQSIIKDWVKRQRPGASLEPRGWGWVVLDGDKPISRIKSTPERAWRDARTFLLDR
jgi:hypothetical protein